MQAFLLPAILGDEPQLVAFRRVLEGRIDFELLDLPDVGAPAALLGSMSETARVVVNEIVRRRPTGAIALVGFSFGASLALEVAAQLARRRRSVGFLGILDGAFRTGELQRSKAELLHLCLSAKGIASLVRRLFERVNNRRRLLAAALARSTAAAQSPAMREAVLVDLRCKALNTWRPPSCAAPGILIFSGTLGAENRQQWIGLCPNLTVVTVEAKHGDFLTWHALERIAQALTERSAAELTGTPAAAE